MELSEYLLEPLRTDGEFTLYRGHHQADARRPSILVLAPTPEHPAPDSLRQMEHEYSLRAELDAAWAVLPLALAQHQGRTMLVFEDPGGEPLDRLVGHPMELTQFLCLAIGLSAALGQLHAHGLVHKDIKPAHALVNAATGQVWLTGLRIASRLARERQAPEPPEFIAGTLAYMSPEQTGRMNRSIDSRSDLYSLGVTFYEMLTGSLPFTANDAMEWVHCHIARQPAPPDERVKDIPSPVSAIIGKLLAKTAEERYQTAAGVEVDLRRCLAEWESTGRVEPFSLGTRDGAERLFMPEQLYGREREFKILLDTFDQVVATGTPALVLVSGYSGIGKTSIVHELDRAIVPARGNFIAGKFDQYKRDIPYAALARAFQPLIRQILGKSEGELVYWRDAIRKGVGANGRLIVNLVPEVQSIIGPQPPVAELAPSEAKTRFHSVFRSFLGVFARQGHPLVLFLDDLQWLDTATLYLLLDLIAHPDIHHLLLIGAFRDNEVGAAQPLVRALDAIRKSKTTVREIVLAPLSLADVSRFVADTLRCPVTRAEPLARLVYDKTLGNPFFVIQFLTALREEHLLEFDARDASWKWDLEQVRAHDHTDNVVDLMVGKLRRLSAATQEALKVFACLGNSAGAATLAAVLGETADSVHADLWDAVREGIVLRRGDSYRFFHDRVQEAAYALIPQEQQAAVHVEIGRLLSAGVAPDALGERVFEVLNQFDRGAGLITSEEERERVAELYLIAGRRAKASTAFASALEYLVAGSTLLPEGCWERRYDLTFALELERAECEFLTGDYAAAKARLAILAGRSSNPIDLAAVVCVRVDLDNTLGRRDLSVDVGLEYLQSVGIHWSPHPAKNTVDEEFERMWRQIGDRSIEELGNLPLMHDPVWRAGMDVLTTLLPPALFSDENLFSLVVARMANLSLEHGNSDGSCLAYVWLGILLGPRYGDYDAAFRFGQLGFDLVERRGLDRFKARVYLDYTHVVNPWMKHIRFGPALAQRALNVANEIGDLTFAAFSSCNLVSALFATGVSLADVQRQAENGLEFAVQARFGLIADIISGQLRLIQALRGLTPSFSSFSGAGFDEFEFERHLDADPGMAVANGWYWVRKLQGRFFADDYLGALKAAAKMEQFLWTVPSHLEMAEYHFYAALARAARYDAAPAADRPGLAEALRSHLRQLTIWAEQCPENFQNRMALVAAEIARIEVRDLDAMRLYAESVRSARENGFVQNEALANERAGRFYLDRGFETNGYAHLRDAHACYALWDAGAKVRQLEQLYPRLAAPEHPLPAPTIGSLVQQLDVTTVVRASQAVSGEIELPKLIEQLLTIALQNAGADRGLLVLRREQDYWIEAQAQAGGEDVEVRMGHAPITGPAVPESVLRYVIRTQETVVLDDAVGANPFSEDDYVHRRQPRSILCLPLVRQGQLAGLLYLENSLTARAFARDRIAVLELLAAQAAIAIQNAWLFRSVSAQRERLRALNARLVEAQEAERRQVARELHDQIGQVLTAVSADLQALELAPKAARVERLGASLTLVSEAIQQVRNLSLELRPALLDEFGLVAAIEWYLDREAQRFGFQAELVVEPSDLRLPPDLETTQFRVAQIALTNVARHAHAKHVRVELRRQDGHADLVIRDDGIGFDVPTALEHASRGATLGLLSLQERVHLAGGEVEITSAPDQGAEIHARFPLE